MSHRYSICLLGFAPDSEERIKKLITQNVSTDEVQFVSANHQQLNSVIVNAVFLSSPQIKKYLAHTKATVVCASNNEEAAQEALAQGFPLLDLRHITSEQGKTWLAALFGKKPATPSPSEAVSSQHHQHEDKVIQLLAHLEQEHSSDILRLESGKNLTWIKLNEGVAWINYPRESIPSIEQWEWKKVEAFEIPDNIRQIKLDLWLFETIWQSNVDERIDRQNMIREQHYYRLVRWPQPLSKYGRTEALRLAACAQTHPVNLSILREKTSYSDATIKRFLLAALKAKQLAVIQAEEVKPRAPTRPQENSSKIEEKRSLLRRLRDKLRISG